MGFASNQVTLTPLEKDYYNILDLPVTATPEQIKDNYRKLAKKYHPDARTVDKTEKDLRTPDGDKFRDVVEAYQVLSVSESRVAYDITRKKNPHLFRPQSEFQNNLVNRIDKRDKQGLIHGDTPARGSYHEDRLS